MNGIENKTSHVDHTDWTIMIRPQELSLSFMCQLWIEFMPMMVLINMLMNMIISILMRMVSKPYDHDADTDADNVHKHDTYGAAPDARAAPRLLRFPNFNFRFRVFGFRSLLSGLLFLMSGFRFAVGFPFSISPAGRIPRGLDTRPDDRKAGNL